MGFSLHLFFALTNQFRYIRNCNRKNMNKSITSKLGLLLAMVAILVSSCSTNATFSKRYHSRGFNIAWGGGLDANKNAVKQTPKKVKASIPVNASTQKSENTSNQSVTVNENTIVNATHSIATGVSNSVLIQNENASIKNQIQLLNNAIKQTKLDSKKAEDNAKTNVVVIAKSKNADPGDGKSQIIALILCICVGVLGIHRFYLGYTMEGVLMLLTAGGCGIWALIDLIRIITGDLKPADGDYTETL